MRRRPPHHAPRDPLPGSEAPRMLDEMEKTISMAELAKHADRIAADMKSAGTIYRIRRPGRRSMVLVDQEYLERYRATCEFIAQHPNWEQELAESDEEYRQGKFIPLEVVLAQLGIADEGATPSKRRASARRVTARGSTTRRKRAAKAARRSP